MLEYNSYEYLPITEELPDSNDEPLDNELQELIPGLLKATLLIMWAERMDWFFGINMGIYYEPEEPPIVPEGFLSLGVERCYDEDLRRNYPLWEENAVPILALEVVSSTYRHEYCKKQQQYDDLGILYYVIYSCHRRYNPRFEVHKLVDGKYVLQKENPVWLPEINLGIGCEQGNYSGVTREWLYWYNQQGKRYPTPEEWVKQEAQRAERLAAKLQELNIDPDNI
jgi:Uma2 family endonuclease